jgi:hypothetical protein
LYPGAPKHLTEQHDRLRKVKKEKTAGIIKRRTTARTHFDKIERLQKSVEKHTKKYQQVLNKADKCQEEVNEVLRQHMMKNERDEDAEVE